MCDYLKEYYESTDEDARLLSRHGSVEYITTRKYIDEALGGDRSKKILEVGAGTGRYSVTLAKEGYSVTAIELLEHNIDVMKTKLTGDEPLKIICGNALDLSCLADESFDLTLVLGPLYHLFTKEDKLRALREALRVTKRGGIIMAAYCMNEPTILQFVFAGDHLSYVFDNNMLTADWHCKSEPKELFDLVRTEDIAELDAGLEAVRLKLIATDGMSHLMRDIVDAMDDAHFEKWIEYHLAVCERQDLVGFSNHTLDILKKN